MRGCGRVADAAPSFAAAAPAAKRLAVAPAAPVAPTPPSVAPTGNDEYDDEEDEMVSVQGRQVALSALTDDDQERMSAEEHKAFLAAYARAYE